jgi:hypothetical protein
MTDTPLCPVHAAMLDHLNHLLDLMPSCSPAEAAQVLAAGLAAVRTMYDLALIDGLDAVALIGRCHDVYLAQIAPPLDEQ